MDGHVTQKSRELKHFYWLLSKISAGRRFGGIVLFGDGRSIGSELKKIIILTMRTINLDRKLAKVPLVTWCRVWPAWVLLLCWPSSWILLRVWRPSLIAIRMTRCWIHWFIPTRILLKFWILFSRINSRIYHWSSSEIFAIPQLISHSRC